MMNNNAYIYFLIIGRLASLLPFLKQKASLCVAISCHLCPPSEPAEESGRQPLNAIQHTFFCIQGLHLRRQSTINHCITAPVTVNGLVT